MKKAIAFLLAALVLLGCAGCSKKQVDVSNAITLTHLAGARIGAQAGTFHAQAATQIDKAQISTYPTFDDLLTALKEGDIDGYIAEEPTAKAVCKTDDSLTYIPLLNNTTGFTVEAADVSACVALKPNSPLRGQINTVLATITNVQKQALMDQAVALAAGETVKAPLELTLDTAVEEDAPVLKVGMECAYEPFNWSTSQKDEFALPITGGSRAGQYADGYDVQIAQYIAKMMGMRLEIHAIQWDGLLAALEDGTVDAIVGGMSPSDNKDANVEYTSAYYESNLVVVIKK